MTWLRFAIPVLFLVLVPTLALAHTTGSSWNASSGAYTLDIGYDPTTITAGEYVRFDFLLWKGPVNTSPQTNYAEVWVRIINPDGSTGLATGIWKQPYGPTTLLYQFPRAGSYWLDVSYRDADSNDIATSTFPVTVTSGSSLVSFRDGIVLLLGLVIGGALALAFARRV